MPKLGAQRRRDCPELRGQVGCGNTGVCGSWGPCPGTLLALTGDQLVQGLGSGTCSHPCGFYQLSALWRQQGPRMMRVKIPPTEHLLGAGPCSHHFAQRLGRFLLEEPGLGRDEGAGSSNKWATSPAASGPHPFPSFLPTFHQGEEAVHLHAASGVGDAQGAAGDQALLGGAPLRGSDQTPARPLARPL